MGAVELQKSTAENAESEKSKKLDGEQCVKCKLSKIRKKKKINCRLNKLATICTKKYEKS